MSHVGERDDAPDLDVEVDGEEHGAVPADTDAGDGDEVGEEPDEREEPDSEEDAAGADEGQAGQSDQVAAKPRSAATIAVQEAKRARKEAAERADRAEARLAEMERERTGQRTAEEQRLEAARLELMSPEEKMTHLLQKQQQEFNGRLAALDYRQWDSSDRTAFEGLCARKPFLDAVRDDVERQVQQMRAAGQQVPQREILAKFFLGERAMARAEKGGKSKQAAKGRDNVQRQTVKPSGGRSDVAGGRERSGGSDAKARAERLSNLEI